MGRTRCFHGTVLKRIELEKLLDEIENEFAKNSRVLSDSTWLIREDREKR